MVINSYSASPAGKLTATSFAVINPWLVSVTLNAYVSLPDNCGIDLGISMVTTGMGTFVSNCVVRVMSYWSCIAVGTTVQVNVMAW